ncbi:hypothetical protein KJ781_00020 [Patescibacteria group bacterium]|nr:hypothetical protein [Patescibacteria group bacterium]MBU1448705.1 hypothetical protein [Patescibacteria group bacterium]MBU2613241.1 hypothetical protein [Patescibacteria group bacterium]
MKRFFALVAAFAVMGAGCVSVDVMTKGAADDATPVVEETIVSEADALAVETSSTESVETTTMPEPVPAAEVRFTDDELRLEAREHADGVVLEWTASSAEVFEGYKVVRSETDALPWYPKDGAVAFLPNRETLTYLDADAEHGGVYHYRICALETDAPPTCGNVVNVERP